MREAPKIESLRSTLPTPLATLGRETTKLNQPRFLGVQFQAELGEPDAELPQKPLRLVSVLETYDEVVGVPYDDDVASAVPLSPLPHPQVENVMQVHVRQERWNH